MFLGNCLPTPSSPKPKLSLVFYLEQNVGLGEEGVGGQFPRNLIIVFNMSWDFNRPKRNWKQLLLKILEVRAKKMYCGVSE